MQIGKSISENSQNMFRKKKYTCNNNLNERKS